MDVLTCRLEWMNGSFADPLLSLIFFPSLWFLIRKLFVWRISATHHNLRKKSFAG